MKKLTVRQMKKKLESFKRQSEKLRDEMRLFEMELEALRGTHDVAIEDLERAIDSLSELV